MTDQYKCGCGHTSTTAGSHCGQPMKKVEQYQCGCGYKSEKQGTHCGEPMTKAA